MDEELASVVIIASKQPADTAAYACALSRWQHFSAWHDVMAAILKV